MSLVRWNPLREINYLTDEFNGHFENFLSLKRRETELPQFEWEPVTNVREDNGNYIVESELPGLKKENIKVTFKNDILTVSGERKEENEKRRTFLFRREAVWFILQVIFFTGWN